MNSGASQKYDVMDVSPIASLDVRSICEEDSWLFMWWLANMPYEALHVVSAWGFKIKTMTCFSWIKKTVNGLDNFGMGFHTRQQQEHCLIAKRGKPKIVSHKVRQNIYSVIGEHSAKPAETRDRIVELVGDLPRIELFAREHPVGWSAWGNKLEKSDIDLGPVSVGSLLSVLSKKTK